MLERFRAAVSRPGIARTQAFLRFLAVRYFDDRCFETAGALSYTSLLAIVPIFAVFLSILSAFPFFATLRDQAEADLSGALLPHAELAVRQQLGNFIDNAAELTGIGVIGLAVTAILLLHTINESFARIWRATHLRPLVVRLLAYWTIISLGPLLFGAALWLSGVLYTTGANFGGSGFAFLAGLLAPFGPLMLETVGFALLYLVVPNRRVGRSNALIGGFTAAAMFELLKHGFALYLVFFPGYQAIYGALAAIPIFLVWMYASWAVILFGAEVAAALAEWRDRKVADFPPAPPGDGAVVPPAKSAVPADSAIPSPSGRH